MFQLGLEDFETLNKDERRQFLNLLRATLISYEHVFKTYEAGLLDEEVWIRYRDAAKHILQLPHLRVWWDARKNAYVPSFVRAIDAAPNVARSKLASEVIREMLEHAHKQD